MSGTLGAVLRDLFRSCASAGCPRVLVINGHGGNDSTCRAAASDASREHGLTIATASYWEVAAPPEGMPFPDHAGEFETSMMLAVRKDLVRLELARPSPGLPYRQLPGVQVNEPSHWARIEGFTDDPTRASVEKGLGLLERFAQALAAIIVAPCSRRPARSRHAHEARRGGTISSRFGACACRKCRFGWSTLTASVGGRRQGRRPRSLCRLSDVFFRVDPRGRERANRAQHRGRGASPGPSCVTCPG
jgi:Creatinine amidohydrolase